ncbi:MAG: serine/threonine-protein kinase [Polyangiales bacterium]
MRPACPQCQNPVTATATRCGRCGATFDAAKADPNLGQLLGNLRLVEKLGSGGMGAVYRAEHVALGTPYAVKVLHRQFSDDEAIAERFRREAVACSMLRHENTVFVTDFGVHEEVGIYLVMEFLEGASLHDVIRAEGPMDLRRFAHAARQMCDAMSAAHRLGIVHRDLKPENIMVLAEGGRDERVKVLDFGIAMLRDAGAPGGGSITRVGTVVGTPAYMSPEQIDRRLGEISALSDVYALGVIFYECATGRRPFEGDSEIALITHQLTVTPDRLGALRAELAGTALESLVAEMLQKDPARRPASMDEVRDALAAAMSELEQRGLVEETRAAMPVARRPLDSRQFTNPDALRSNPSLQITGVLRRIVEDAPDSPAALLLSALPEADAMRGEAIALALWGVLQDELLDAPVGDPRFARGAAQLALLLEGTLLSREGARPTPSQEKVFRALKNLLALASPERQAAIIEAIAHLADRAHFPFEALPKHAALSAPTTTLAEKLKQPVSVSAVKALLTHEIGIFGRRRKDP